MNRPPIVERWRREVFRDRRIPDAPRVLALALADEMDSRGHVSVKRAELAAMLGVYPSRVDDRISALRVARYLDVVSRSAPTRPAVYAATFPAQPGTNVPGSGWDVNTVTAGNVDAERCRLTRERPTTPIGTLRADVPGSAGNVPIETPDQDDPWAAGAPHPQTAAAQTKDAATKNSNDGLSALGRALALTPITPDLDWPDQPDMDPWST